MAVKPKTKLRLQIFDPMTFPMAIFECPDNADHVEINNSGAEVPNATTVNPTTKGEIIILYARLEAPRTKKSPPKIRITIPTIDKAIGSSIIFSKQTRAFKNLNLKIK